MNIIKDFTDYLQENKYSEGSNFELVACKFIKEYCDVADLAYLMKHLSEIYTNKLYYITRKNYELQDLFHKEANLDEVPDSVKRIFSKLEDEMFLLNSSYSGDED